MTDPTPRVFRSIPEIFFSRVAQTPKAEAYRFPMGEVWHSMTWEQVALQVRAIACGLRALGVQSEERCAILASTRVEWVLCDLGILCAGAATTTIYPSSTAEDCAYILADSGSVVIFAEDDSQVAKLRQQRKELPGLRKVIAMAGRAAGDWVMALSDLEETGLAHDSANPDELEEICRSIDPEQLATLIYTSGTTGRPKGVRLVHDCWAYEAQAMAGLGIMRQDDLQYLWLPLSHSFGKVLQIAPILLGLPTAIDGRIPKLVENLGLVRPTFMAAAPRVFEKVYNKVVGSATEVGGIKLKLFRWAVGIGRQVSRLRQNRSVPGLWLRIKYKIAMRLVLSKIKALFGGRMRFCISGSAPLSVEIAEFFHAADLLVLEGYGLTETSAATFVNRPDKYRFGTVGFPLEGTELALAEEDQEIRIRGRGVMRGYHQLPEQTAAVLDEDGWLHTGDIGEIDSDGFLRITDRKKDLIKTSGGKYVAPQLIEGRLKALCPYVSQVIVHGDRRNYCTALIALEEEALTGWASKNGIAGKSYEALTRLERVRDLIREYVDELNEGLASYETVKNFAILPADLTIEGGELTPSLKVKRRAVERKYMNLLNAMYAGTIRRL